MENNRTITTPRGTFKLEEYATHTWEKEEEINKQGFHYWFSKLTKTNDCIIDERIYIKQGKLPIQYKVLKMIEVNA